MSLNDIIDIQIAGYSVPSDADSGEGDVTPPAGDGNVQIKTDGSGNVQVNLDGSGKVQDEI